MDHRSLVFVLVATGCAATRTIPPNVADDTPPKISVIFDIVDPDAPDKSGRTVWNYNDPRPKFELGTRARVSIVATATDDESGLASVKLEVSSSCGPKKNPGVGTTQVTTGNPNERRPTLVVAHRYTFEDAKLRKAIKDVCPDPFGLGFTTLTLSVEGYAENWNRRAIRMSKDLFLFAEIAVRFERASL